MTNVPVTSNFDIVRHLLAAILPTESNPLPIALIRIEEQHSIESLTPSHIPIEAETTDKGIGVRATSELAHRPVVIIPHCERLRHKELDTHELSLLACDSNTARHTFVAVIPFGSLISKRGARFRKLFLEKWHPELVAYVPGGVDGMHDAARTAILVLSPASDNISRPTRFFLAPEDWQDSIESISTDLSHLLRMKGGSRTYGYVVRDWRTSDRDFDFIKNDPRIQERRIQSEAFGSITRLDSVFDILAQVFQHRISKNQSVVEPFSKGSARTISEHEIQTGRQIVAAHKYSQWISVPEEKMLRGGDIVLRGKYEWRNENGFIWARVHTNDLPLTLGYSTLAMRPKAEIPSATIDFVLRYLSSRLSYELNQDSLENPSLQWIPSLFRVTPATLSQLFIPLPGEDLVSALEAIHYARDRADEWRKHADRTLNSIFEDESASASRQRILVQSRPVRWRMDAADALDTLDGQVRSLYPYPIAYRWRFTSVQLSHALNRESYTAVLDTAEQLIAYIACISLGLARSIGVLTSTGAQIGNGLVRGRGPGLGDWNSVINEISGKKLSALDDIAGVNELRQFCGNTDVKKVRTSLAKRRNDEAHNRRIDVVDLPIACKDAANELVFLLEQCAFLVDLQLILIDSTHWDSLSNTGYVRYRRMVGDHPVVPVAKMSIHDPGLEESSLYLSDASGNLHLLRPFLLARNCPTCRNLSTFHVDHINNGVATIKSLEHGHTLDDIGTFDALQLVGIIPKEPPQG